MRTHDYTRAVTELLIAGRDVPYVLEALRAMLKKRGHEMLYPSILKSVLVALEARSASERASVVVDNETDIAHYAHALAAALENLGSDGTYTVVTDPTLIGGFKATYAHKTIDQSYKRQLVALYRSLTE